MEKSHAVLLELASPAYPLAAQGARISADVKIRLAIRQDDSIAAVEVINGYTVLAPEALESARKSDFQCMHCDAAAATDLPTFSFEVRDDMGSDANWSGPPVVTHEQDRIVVSAAQRELPLSGEMRASQAEQSVKRTASSQTSRHLIWG